MWRALIRKGRADIVSRPLQNVLLLVVIGVGAATLTLSMTISGAQSQSVESWVEETNAAHVWYSSDPDTLDSLAERAFVEEYSGAHPALNGGTLLTGAIPHDLSFHGIDPASTTIAFGAVRAGRWPADVAAGTATLEAALDPGLARELDLGLGDTISVATRGGVFDLDVVGLIVPTHTSSLPGMEHGRCLRHAGRRGHARRWPTRPLGRRLPPGRPASRGRVHARGRGDAACDAPAVLRRPLMADDPRRYPGGEPGRIAAPRDLRWIHTLRRRADHRQLGDGPGAGATPRCGAAQVHRRYTRAGRDAARGRGGRGRGRRCGHRRCRRSLHHADLPERDRRAPGQLREWLPVPVRRGRCVRRGAGSRSDRYVDPCDPRWPHEHRSGARRRLECGRRSLPTGAPGRSNARAARRCLRHEGPIHTAARGPGSRLARSASPQPRSSPPRRSNRPSTA